MAAAVVVPVLVVPVVALALSTSYGGNPLGKRVYMLGDSITADATNTITSDLNPSYAWFVLGQPGYEIAQSEQQLGGPLGLHNNPPPQYVVLELGTNDAVQNNANWQADYDEMWSQVSSEECVTFVTVATNLSTSPLIQLMDAEHVADVNDGIAADIDAWIQAKKATAANVRVADWATAVAMHPTLLTSDGVHPNPQGAAALAALVVQAENSCN